MNIVSKIARAELRGLYYSPVAWFLSILVFIHLASYLVVFIYTGYVGQEIIDQMNPDHVGIRSITHMVMNQSNGGLVPNVLQYLFFYFPLLTMGLISAEMNRGSIKLLQSSPIKVSSVVKGKMLAMVLYITFLMFIMAVFCAYGIFTIEHVQIPLMLSAMLGFFLLLCVYAAVGMFMSSLTTYPVVSGIATFIVLFLLGYVGSFLQKYDFLRDLTFSLGMNRGGSPRVGYFVKGLITSRDLIYFITITLMFVSFTYFRLKGMMDPKPWFVRGIRYVFMFIVSLLLLYTSSRYQWTKYWDVSREKLNTIHPETQKLLRDFDENYPVEVAVYGNYFSKLYGLTVPETRNAGLLTELWEQYIRFKPDMKFNYRYYYDMAYQDSITFKNLGKPAEEVFEITKKANQGVHTSRLISPDSMRTIYDFEDEKYESVMVLSYKDRSVILRFYSPPAPWPEEIHVATALKVLQSETGLKKVRLTSGNLERSPYKRGEREYSRYFIGRESTMSLINLGFDSDTLNLEFEEIEKDIDILVVADPKTELSPIAQAKIKHYLAEGGNAYFLGEPNKEMVLNPLISDLGVELAPGMVLEVTYHETPDKVMSYPPYYPLKDLAPGAHHNYEQERAEAAEKFDLDTYIDKDADYLARLTPTTTEVLIKDSSMYSSKVLLTTIEERQAFRKLGRVVLDSVPPQFDPENGDVRKSSFATTVGLTREFPTKQQRVLVSGDADFFSNLRNTRPYLFQTPAFSWLVDNQYPAYVPEEPSTDVRFKDTLTSRSASIIMHIFLWVLPALFILLAIVFLVRRQRM